MANKKKFYRTEPKQAERPARKISPARLAAYEILLKIEKERAFSSILLPFYEEKLEPLDRGLCHELTLGVLRRQIYLDKIIGQFAKQKLDAEVRIALRLGLYQLLFLDRIPAYPAINESVNLVEKARKTSAKGFVNAILRRAQREPATLIFTDELERISVETSHPRSLLERWVDEFGLDEATRLAAANNETPGTDFRLTAKTTAQTRALLDSAQTDGANPGLLRELAEKGEIYFQDAASQLVGTAVGLTETEKFLDVCAAPGSKLTQIATNRSQTVFGGDLYANRLTQIGQSAAAQGLKNVSLVRYDAEAALPFADETFDVILLDAPCSGTGTIRHNPEIRYYLNESDFSELSGKQLNLLRNASKTLKRGGRLIYSTCSLEKDENEAVIEKFLADAPDFSKTNHELLTRFRTNEGFARTYPHRDGMDGFFIAVLIRQ